MAALWTAGMSAADDATLIRLKQQAVIDEQVITLADVAELPEDAPERLRDLELGNAPWPGHRRRVSRELVEMRMAAAGFRQDRYRVAGAEQCTVGVATERVGKKRLLAAARRFLRGQYSGGADVSITCIEEPEAVLVEVGDGEVSIEPGIRNRRRGRGELMVGLDIVRSGSVLEQVSARFRVQLRRQVLIAARRIPRGTSPGRDAVGTDTRDVARVSGTPMTSREDLENSKTVRTIPAGQVITRDMLKERKNRIVVRANERVRLVARGGGLRVSTVGRALSTARKGETVTAENAKTGRRVSGLAAGDGRVVITMGAAK
jgi:flagella basal body P-ring formation protein FlgA